MEIRNTTAAGNNRTPKHFPIETYLEQLNANIGRDIEVSTIVNQRAVNTARGVLSVVTPRFFGVSIAAKDSTFMRTYLFTDVFTGKVVYVLQ